MRDLELQLKKIEKIIGCELPNYFKKFYQDEQDKVETIKRFNIMNFDAVFNECLTQEDDGILFDDYLKSVQEGSIKNVRYSKKRVPFICDGSGNYIGLDFDPDTNGTIGQVINYGCDEDKMYVFANSFKDFILGILTLYDYDFNTYITDYLINNNINFIKQINSSDVPKRISGAVLEKKNIEEEKINEFTQSICFDESRLSEIISFINKTIAQIKNNENVLKIIPIYTNYRIKNYKDSLSRTMDSVEHFWLKLETYPKDEIKGYSMTLMLELEEEFNNQIIKHGKETIFVDIDKDNVLVRYRETIGNEQMKETYNSLCRFFSTIL